MKAVQIAKKSLFLLAVLGFALQASAATIGVGETYTLSSTSTLSDNLYLASGTVIISGPVKGDSVIASGDATLSSEVSGDVLIAAGSAEVLGRVGGDLRVAAGKVTVAEAVGGDLVIAGGNVSVLSNTRVAHDVIVAGGRVSLLGEINGNVYVAGGDIFIDGKIGGNVKAYSGSRMHIGPNAVIGGDLNYKGGKEALIDPKAVVKGNINYSFATPIISAGDLRGFFSAIFGIAFILRIIILVFATLFFVLVFRRVSGSLAQLSVGEFWKMTLIGLIVFVALPFASLLVLVTIFGSLIAAVALTLWLLLVLLGQVYAGIVFAYVCGVYLFRKEMSAFPSAKVSVLGVLGLNILCLVPYLGIFLCFVFFLNAVGTLSFLGYRHFFLSRK